MTEVVPESVNRQWCLAARPRGMVEPSNFDLVEGPVPVPGAGEVLVTSHGDHRVAAFDAAGSYRIRGVIDRLVRARDGAIEITDARFMSLDHLRQVIERIVSQQLAQPLSRFGNTRA